MSGAILEARNFAAALSSFRGLIRKHASPFVECVRIEWKNSRVVLEGTDLDRELMREVPAETDGVGAALVSFERLARYVGLCGNHEAEIGLNGDGIFAVRTPISSCELPSLNPLDWPRMDRSDGAQTFVVEASELRRVSDFCADAAGTLIDRIYFCGIWIDTESDPLAVAVNGHVGAVTPFAIKRGSAKSPDGPVPTAAFVLASSIATGEVEIAVTDQKAEFVWSGGRLITRMINGTFPRHWRRGFSIDADRRASIKLSELLTASRRIAAACGDFVTGIAIDENRLRMRARDERGPSGSEEVSCEADAAVVFGMNSDYITSALQALAGIAENKDAASIVVSWAGRERPFRFALAGDPATYRAVMPLVPKVVPE